MKSPLVSAAVALACLVGASSVAFGQTTEPPPAKPATRPAVAKPVAKPTTVKAAPVMVVRPPTTTPAAIARVQGLQLAQPNPVMVAAASNKAVPARTPAKPAAAQRPGRYGVTAPAAASLSPYAPPQEKLAPPRDDGSPRTLTLFNMNSQESLTVTYRRGGQYIQGELAKLNDFLRDSRNSETTQMDPETLDILWHVGRSLGSTSFEVLSAYRSPQTNAWLASTSRGVARDSLHMRGQAIDVKMPGFTPYQIREAARALGLGGVGYYPRTGFVHIDSGPVRYW